MSNRMACASTQDSSTWQTHSDQRLNQSHVILQLMFYTCTSRALQRLYFKLLKSRSVSSSREQYLYLLWVKKNSILRGLIFLFFSAHDSISYCLFLRVYSSVHHCLYSHSHYLYFCFSAFAFIFFNVFFFWVYFYFCSLYFHFFKFYIYKCFHFLFQCWHFCFSLFIFLCSLFTLVFFHVYTTVFERLYFYVQCLCCCYTVCVFLNFCFFWWCSVFGETFITFSL